MFQILWDPSCLWSGDLNSVNILQIKTQRWVCKPSNSNCSPKLLFSQNVTLNKNVKCKDYYSVFLIFLVNTSRFLFTCVALNSRLRNCKLSKCRTSTLTTLTLLQPERPCAQIQEFSDTWMKEPGERQPEEDEAQWRHQLAGHQLLTGNPHRP